LNKKNKFFKRSGGFTLVELLIVIGLLGAIALIVIAAINPIEQANRARDTRFKADSAQLISAIDRYFAARSEFPWVTLASLSLNNDDAFGFITASAEGVGICGSACTTTGALITSDELKTAFANRDFVQDDGDDNSQKILIGKEEGTSASIYACFVPMSKATRQGSVADGNVYTINNGTGVRTETTNCDADTANWVTLGCYVCIPE